MKKACLIVFFFYFHCYRKITLKYSLFLCLFFYIYFIFFMQTFEPKLISINHILYSFLFFQVFISQYFTLLSQVLNGHNSEQLGCVSNNLSCINESIHPFPGNLYSMSQQGLFFFLRSLTHSHCFSAFRAATLYFCSFCISVTETGHRTLG